MTKELVEVLSGVVGVIGLVVCAGVCALTLLMLLRVVQVFASVSTIVSTKELYTIFRSIVQPEKTIEHEKKPEEEPVKRAEEPAKKPENESAVGVPTAYCGHCGEGIYRDPVEAFDLIGLAVVVFECPKCTKRTLLNPEGLAALGGPAVAELPIPASRSECS